MTQKIEIEYDLANALEIVSGISKAGKPFGPVLGVKQSERWNSFVIAIAKKQGVQERKVNAQPAED
jgi:hypothetical protein